jgi:hypothetical protein
MNNVFRRFPAVARRFPELAALSNMTDGEANTVRSEAYQDLYGKLTDKEKAFADRKGEELMAMMPTQQLGKQGAWELLVALAQAMEWADWPERE